MSTTPKEIKSELDKNSIEKVIWDGKSFVGSPYYRQMKGLQTAEEITADKLKQQQAQQNEQEAKAIKEKQKAEKLKQQKDQQRKHDIKEHEKKIKQQQKEPAKLYAEKTPLIITRPKVTIKAPLAPADLKQSDKKHLLTIVKPKSSISSFVALSITRFSGTTPVYAAACSSQNLSFDYRVDYSDAKDAKTKAKLTDPTMKGRGKELVTEEPQWRPEPDERAFGEYKCKCGNHWMSACGWINETQACKECGNNVPPKNLTPFNHTATEADKIEKPHEQSLCSKCKKLGRLCVLSMKRSSNTDHPNDVMVKGLPLDITEEKLLETFRPYDYILSAHILPPKPGFYHRIAFITFQNPELALQKFNKLDVLVDKPKYKY